MHIIQHDHLKNGSFHTAKIEESTTTFLHDQQYSHEYVWICLLRFMDDCFMNKAQHNAGFACRLKLSVEAVPTVKEHESEPKALSETHVFFWHYEHILA